MQTPRSSLNFFTGRMLLLTPNQPCQSTWGKLLLLSLHNISFKHLKTNYRENVCSLINYIISYRRVLLTNWKASCKMSTSKLLFLNRYILSVNNNYLLARTIRVCVTFSMVNLVLPWCPASRPIARDKWSPFNGLTAAHNTEERIHTVNLQH